MDAFLNGNAALIEIFRKDFKIPVEEFEERRSEIDLTNMQIVEQLLDQIGDKHFHIFTYHDDNHSNLVELQQDKVMNFGIDIEHAIEEAYVYILIMDKKPEYSKLDVI